MDDYYVKLTLQEICHSAGLDTQQLLEIVEQGIIKPAGDAPDQWTFDVETVSVVRRASRLHYDLEIDWPTIALVLDLLDAKERLQQENALLRRQLERFMID